MGLRQLNESCDGGRMTAASYPDQTHVPRYLRIDKEPGLNTWYHCAELGYDADTQTAGDHVLYPVFAFAGEDKRRIGLTPISYFGQVVAILAIDAPQVAFTIDLAHGDTVQSCEAMAFGKSDHETLSIEQLCIKAIGKTLRIGHDRQINLATFDAFGKVLWNALDQSEGDPRITMTKIGEQSGKPARPDCAHNAESNMCLL
jgi:hypothetical protein